jgi:hypothetical protein
MKRIALIVQQVEKDESRVQQKPCSAHAVTQVPGEESALHDAAGKPPPASHSSFLQEREQRKMLQNALMNKRGALYDTVAIKRRMTAIENSSINEVGPQAMVDLALHQHDPTLFSLSGEDLDRLQYPNFPFDINALAKQPPGPDTAAFVHLSDHHNIAEDKLNTTRYREQLIESRLEKSNLIRRLLHHNFSDKELETDDDRLQAELDWQQWKAATAKTAPPVAMEDLKLLVAQEQKERWTRVTTGHQWGLAFIPIQMWQDRSNSL